MRSDIKEEAEKVVKLFKVQFMELIIASIGILSQTTDQIQQEINQSCDGCQEINFSTIVTLLQHEPPEMITPIVSLVVRINAFVKLATQGLAVLDQAELKAICEVEKFYINYKNELDECLHQADEEFKLSLFQC